MKNIEMTIVRGGKKTKNLTKKNTNQNQNSSSKKSNQNSGSLIVWIHIKNRLWKKVGVRKKTLKIIMQPLSRADRSCFRSLRTDGRSENLRGQKIILDYIFPLFLKNWTRGKGANPPPPPPPLLTALEGMNHLYTIHYFWTCVPVHVV